MTELSGYVFEPLWEEGEFVLSRGMRDGEGAPLLVLSSALAQPTPGSLRRLEHAYGLRGELDPSWATRPLELVWSQGRPALLLADPGGELLARLLGYPWELTQFLRLALGLAGALRQLHARGLIHKDIKPAHILVNPATGEVWLTGFGITSRLPRERQVPEPPEMIAGTLAYMAPEQTGRMNRSVDSRSDLYAYGVTLYELLTGTLPFTAAEPMEWIHCHIARPPTPPSERVSVIPAVICALVMKLLSKNAEDRYQTAAGVEADLRRCLTEWESLGRIELFPLGTQDIPDKLLIPEKLYGREREIDTLLAAFDRVVASGRPELVLVSGYSGIGKSSVVNELHKVLVPPRGLFAAGKFDQYKRDIPYATLAQAFQSLVRQLLSKNDAELASWRQALLEALGPNGQLIVNLISELVLIIGEQPPVPDLPPQDAQRRFQVVFRRFLGVFASAEHPLTLFLDDLQWLDAATLELVEYVLTQPEVRHLMLIGAYRDNEVDRSHPLTRKLDAIRSAGATVHEIRLEPLASEDVAQLIAESLRCAPERATGLAHLVHDKTGGNPFFVLQFLSALSDESLLAFEPEAARWAWDLERIQARGYTDNVADLMVEKLTHLPRDAQTALEQLACLGNRAAVATLARVRGATEEQVHAALWEAVRLELIERREGSYKFVHDRVQEAAYSLIPEVSRASAHLQIGRLLAAQTPPEQRQETIFEIVNQFNRGAALITDQEEREQLAELNLIAGKRAKASAAYASALNYLVTGAVLLPEDSWERRRELSFELELHRAECEFLTGALAEAEERLHVLSTHAAATIERACVACLRADLYVTLGQQSRAVAVGLDYLSHLGIDWAPHPTEEEARREYERIWSQLGSGTIEDLIELPLMTDPAPLATMDVLTKLVPPAFYTDANLLSLVICRAVNLSLQYGNSDGSCYAYVTLGMVAGPYFGNYQAGFRFGRLGYELVEQRGLTRFQAGTYMDFGNSVLPWTRHVKTGRDLVRRAFESANESGDLTFAAYSCANLDSNLLMAGDPLREAQREAEHGVAFAQRARFGFFADCCATHLGLIRTLRGQTPRFGSFDDGQFDELRIEQRFSEDPDLAIIECWYWVRKLQARFFAGEYAVAVEASLRAQRLLWSSPSKLETAEHHFYSALSRAASCDSALVDQRQEHWEALAVHYRQLEIWAEHCPENFVNRAALVGAEIARLEGRDSDAMRLYEQAIQSARANGFVHNEALANELAGRFYLQRGCETAGSAYLRKAHACYALWGADGKVRQLDRCYPHVREEAVSLRPATTIGAPIEHLDLATVVKVSQAVSSEIDPQKLINVLMVTALEHAGAERALLILPQGDEVLIEAEAITISDRVEVRLRHAAVTPAELPETVLHYVLRTQESVLLDDAAAPNLFSADAYLHQTHARSILCLPLVKQATLVGVLYLENTLTPHVFTPTRHAVLQLLASQAAISLENARLYTDLQHENRERQRAEERLQRNETYLVEAQRLGLTGSLAWNVAAGKLVHWSQEHYRMYGLDPQRGIPSWEVIRQHTHPEDRARCLEIIERAICEGAVCELDYRAVLPDGAIKYIHSVGHPVFNASGDLVEYVGTQMDVTERKRAEALLAGEKRLLEMIATGNSLSIILDALCRFVEELSEGSLSSILLLDADGHRLRHGAAPSLPKIYTDAIDGSLIGPAAGSCGTAAYRKEPIIVSDIAQDPLWAEYRDLALAHGLRACWSTPVLASDGRVLGTFAIYSREPGSPAPQQQNIIAQITNLTSIAIERKRAEEERQAHLGFLESMDRVNRAIQGTNDLEQMMSDVLDAVLSIFNCDRAWLVYPCDPEAASWKVPMEHTRPEFPGAFVLGLDFPVNPDLANMFHTVRASSDPVRFGPGSEHPLPAEVAQRFSIQSLMTMAIYPKGDKPYMLGLHQCSYPRLWTPQEGRLFQGIGRRLEDALTSLLMLRNLRESERKLEEAQRLTHVGYWELDPSTDLLTWSDETYRICGLPPQGRILNLAQLPELIHPEDQQIIVQAVAEALRSGPRYDVEYRVVRPNGEVRLVHARGDVMRDESGRPLRMFGTVQDLTERKRAEEALRKGERQFRALFDQAAVGIAFVNSAGQALESNRKLQQMLGYSAEEFHSMSFAQYTHPDDLNLDWTLFAELVSGKRDYYQLEKRYYRKDGSLTWGNLTVSLVRDDKGEPLFGISIIEDIIERKRTEEALREAQAGLAHVTRVATLGEMTTSIAHEINQPLGAIVNSASASLRWLDAQKLEEARRSVSRVIAEGHRASDIIGRIRALAKKAPPRKDWLDLNETIQEVIALAHSEVQRNGVALKTHLSAAAPVIWADRIQLQQVMLNLLMNAIEAMSGSGEDPRELVVRSSPDGLQGVLVAVQDSGPGLDPQSLERLFEAFYTTKPHGLGMGLAISRSIIEAHGGRLWATANAPHGAVFQFTLPLGGERVA